MTEIAVCLQGHLSWGLWPAGKPWLGSEAVMMASHHGGGSRRNPGSPWHLTSLTTNAAGAPQGPEWSVTQTCETERVMHNVLQLPQAMLQVPEQVMEQVCSNGCPLTAGVSQGDAPQRDGEAACHGRHRGASLGPRIPADLPHRPLDSECVCSGGSIVCARETRCKRPSGREGSDKLRHRAFPPQAAIWPREPGRVRGQVPPENV